MTKFEKEMQRTNIITAYKLGIISREEAMNRMMLLYNTNCFN